MAEQPLSGWQCQACGVINGHGMTAIPSNCANCGLPRTTRAYPAFDMKLGRVVQSPNVIYCPHGYSTDPTRCRLCYPRDKDGIRAVSVPISPPSPAETPELILSFEEAAAVDTIVGRIDTMEAIREWTAVPLRDLKLLAKCIRLDAKRIESLRARQFGSPRAAQPATTDAHEPPTRSNDRPPNVPTLVISHTAFDEIAGYLREAGVSIDEGCTAISLSETPIRQLVSSASYRDNVEKLRSSDR